MGFCMSLPILKRRCSKKHAEGATMYKKETSRNEKEVAGENLVRKLEDNIKKAEDIISKEEENIKKTQEEEFQAQQVQTQQPDSEGVFHRLRQSQPTQSNLRASFHGWVKDLPETKSGVHHPLPDIRQVEPFPPPERRIARVFTSYQHRELERDQADLEKLGNCCGWRENRYTY